jgi:hypothetical protein
MLTGSESKGMIAWTRLLATLGDFRVVSAGGTEAEANCVIGIFHAI